MLMSVHVCVCPGQTCLEHSIFIILAQIFKQSTKRAFREHSESIQRALREHSESIQRELRGH